MKIILIRLLALLLISFSLFMFTMTFLISDQQIESTLKNNKLVYSALNDARNGVDKFIAREGRIPSLDEWTSITLDYTDTEQEAWYKHYSVMYQNNNYPDEIIEKYGSPKKGGYLIFLWRGEWAEYYISWKDIYTVTDSEAKWLREYYYGSIAYILIPILIAIFMWRIASRSKRMASSIATL